MANSSSRRRIGRTPPPHLKAIAGARAQPDNALRQARKAAERHPEDAAAWCHYGIVSARIAPLRMSPELQQAQATLMRALELDPEAADARAWLSVVCYHLGEYERAAELAQTVLDEAPEQPQALWIQAMLDHNAGRNQQALERLEQACDHALAHDRTFLEELRARQLNHLGRLDEAISAYEAILAKAPDKWNHWNNIALVHRERSDRPAAEAAYERALELAGDQSSNAYSNLVTLRHYDPAQSRAALCTLSQEWQSRFAPVQVPARPRPEDRAPQRRLRIGLFSDGFRTHPVGQMITAALERLSSAEVELVLYPTHAEHDHITKRLRRLAAQWTPINNLTDDGFYQQLITDRIDILFDLAGHHSGNRARVVALQPAPLIVKWVGGLINTTGVAAIDYLISDHIETPPGAEEDAFYTEKLIRLPDDYIVYQPPRYAPAVAPLPALESGFVTLGCFNNPLKLSPELAREWAPLLQALPNARLLLKGRAFGSEVVCARIRSQFAAEGIDEERLLLEGPSHHKGLLEAYNRVDIALDTWPYSGGLTTCEALLMGVPVVTLPGPTFAGRHSATHLTNAGLPELVTDSWEAFRARVIELAGDLDSLATIRQHLREVLLQSPVCDGKRFARHFMIALRAIWQRYCEDKPPAALTFDQQGQAWFEDDTEPVAVTIHEPQEQAPQGFQWQLPSKLVTIDNASKLLRVGALPILLKTRAFAIVAFDPQSLVEQPERFSNAEQVQLFRHALLGDGQPATLHACLEPGLSSTLAPLPAEQLPPALRDGARVLAELPISTIALDSIEGLESLDWLILDALSDAATILEHGTQTLKNSLLIEVRINFERTHQRQPSLDEISYWASRNGFRFYSFRDLGRRSHLPERDDYLKKQSSELILADALFLPNAARLAELSDEQCLKLAFLLHTVYGIRDLSHELLARVDTDKAEAYLIAERIVKPPVEEGASKDEAEGNIMVDVGGGALDEGEADPDPGLEPAPGGEQDDEFVFD